MITTNNKLIVEPYKGSGKIETTVTSGYASIKQRNSLVGLKILTDITIALHEGRHLEFKAGQVAYFDEELLASQKWAKKQYKADFMENTFALIDYHHVVMVK